MDLQITITAFLEQLKQHQPTTLSSTLVTRTWCRSSFKFQTYQFCPPHGSSSLWRPKTHKRTNCSRTSTFHSLYKCNRGRCNSPLSHRALQVQVRIQHDHTVIAGRDETIFMISQLSEPSESISLSKVSCVSNERIVLQILHMLGLRRDINTSLRTPA